MAPIDDMPEDATPQRSDFCRLEHPMFGKLGGISFRRSVSDGAPMMMLPFGEREAGLPLRSLQQAFEIADDSPDGMMLGQIAQSLDYVTCLHPGDRLPAEVTTGEASWEPDEEHRRITSTRLRLQLLTWAAPETVRDAGPDIEARLECDPLIRGKLQHAFREAASFLELASSEEVVAIVTRLGDELAFIEALRERLLIPAQVMAFRLGRLAGSAARLDQARRSDITQVKRLATTAADGFRVRFDELDGQTGEIMPTLRNIDSQIAYVRSGRDGLYRNLRAWKQPLESWRTFEQDGGDLWPLINETYQFLARRYLPSSEWPVFNSLRRGAAAKPQDRMIW